MKPSNREGFVVVRPRRPLRITLAWPLACSHSIFGTRFDFSAYYYVRRSRMAAPTPATPVSLEGRVLRQLLVVSLGAFGFGFVLTLALLAWLLARNTPAEARWWDILHVGIGSIEVSVLVGLCTTGIAACLLSRWQFRRGMHHCHFCDRPRRSIDDICDCRESEASR